MFLSVEKMRSKMFLNVKRIKSREKCLDQKCPVICYWKKKIIIMKIMYLLIETIKCLWKKTNAESNVST